MAAATVRDFAPEGDDAPAETETETARPAVPEIGALYEAHFRYVWRCLRALGVRQRDLDDALQDVFVVAQRRLADFDGRSRLSTWLYAIALRVARKYRERLGRERLRFDESSASELAASSPSAEAALDRDERLVAARRALAELDDDKREVFVLAHVEERSAPEIAEIVGIPVNTVYSRLRAARLAVSAALRRYALRGGPP